MSRSSPLWIDLRIRLVGGSLLRRTVVSVAAFTMSTCLLLGLISMAAVGVTRAIVGGEPPTDDSVAAAEALDGEAPSSAKGETAQSTRSKSKSARSGTSTRRPGGAVSPSDALRAKADEGDGS